MAITLPLKLQGRERFCLAVDRQQHGICDVSSWGPERLGALTRTCEGRHKEQHVTSILREKQLPPPALMTESILYFLTTDNIIKDRKDSMELTEVGNIPCWTVSFYESDLEYRLWSQTAWTQIPVPQSASGASFLISPCLDFFHL